jgi:hypothetical protein
VTVSANALGAASRALARRLGIPGVVTWSVLGVALALLALDDERRERVSGALRPVGAALWDELLRSAEADKVLIASALAAPAVPPLECRVSKTLLVSHKAQTVGEIRNALESGSDAELLPAEAAIRTMLRELPCFVEGPRHRWQLGRFMTPPVGSPTQGE